MTPIKMSIDELLEKPSGCQHTKLFQGTSDAVEAIATGLRHFNLIWAIDRGEIRPSLEQIDLYRLIDRLLMIKRARWPGVSFDISGPRVLVVSDRLLIDYIVSELIDNAVRALSKKIYLYIYSRRGKWAVMVKDNGRGVQLDELNKLTTPYFCCSDNQSRRFGLGLHVADRIAVALDLQLTISRNADQGLSVRIGNYDGRMGTAI